VQRDGGRRRFPGRRLRCTGAARRWPLDVLAADLRFLLVPGPDLVAAGNAVGGQRATHARRLAAVAVAFRTVGEPRRLVCPRPTHGRPVRPGNTVARPGGGRTNAGPRPRVPRRSGGLPAQSALLSCLRTAAAPSFPRRDESTARRSDLGAHGSVSIPERLCAFSRRPPHRPTDLLSSGPRGDRLLRPQRRRRSSTPAGLVGLL